MNRITVGLALVLCSLAPTALISAAEKDNVPILRLNAGGPVSFVTSLAFSPDGKVLYAAGRDKVVHAWVWKEAYAGAGQFVYQPELTWRVPVGPRFEGAINAIAVSDDGRWIAAAGQGNQSDPRVAGLRDDRALLWPGAAMTTDMRLDEGMIYVFDTQTRKAIALREHRGAVVALEFAPHRAGKPPILVSAAEEYSKGDFQGAIRVWNLQQPNKSISALGGLPSPEGRRPGLSVWHTGENPQDVRVAIAWGDNNREKQTGTFRVWDAAQKTWSVRNTNPHALTVAAVPEKNALVTAVAGDIGVWPLPPNNLLGSYQSLGTIDPRSIPLAVAEFKSRPQGNLDRVAFVIGAPAAGNRWDVGLRFVDLNTERLLPDDIKLWSGPLRLVSIATAANGELMAISGNGQNEVLIYRTSDLLAGAQQAKPIQRLRGSGHAQQFVAFAKRGENTGLVLNAKPRSAAGQNALQANDQVFDITARSLSAETQGWKIVTPDRGGWEAVPVERDAGPGLEFQLNGVRQRTLDLQADKEFDGVRVLDAWAVCQATDHCPAPVAAVATETSGLPQLSLYDMQSGQELRRFSGHVESIADMAFSEDGRLLATTSHDHTISVWWLADIADTLLGKHGLIRKLKLSDDEGAIIVDRGLPELPQGSQITGAARRGANGENVPLPFITAWDFYRYVSQLKPGQSAMITIAGRAQPVAIPVEQATDERKPLFSLFFPEGDEPTWIGWHPIGKYDAQGRNAESSLGWHFNTGDPKTPARFASTGEYRRQNYAPGLLEHLIKHGTPPVAEPPTPSMSLEIIAPQDGLVYQDPPNRHLVARTDQLLAQVEIMRSTENATFTADVFPVGNIKSLQWRLGQANAPFHDFALTNDLTWEADLSAAPWETGVREFLVRLETDELPPRVFEIKQQLRFQRPTPTINLNVPKAHTRTPVKKFAFTGEIVDRADDVNATIKITTWNDGQPQTKTIGPKLFALEELKAALKHAVDLTAGANRFEVIATNAHAMSGYEDIETARSVFTVEFVESGPPVIVLSSVDEIDGRSGLKFPTGTVTVETPEVKLTSRIEADAGLESAELVVLRGDKTVMREILAVDSSKIDVANTVKLEPGPQTIRLQATTKGGRTDQFDLVVNYIPPTPYVLLTSPKTRRVSLTSPVAPRVEIEASLLSASGVSLTDQQIDKSATMFVNGTRIEAAPRIETSENNPRRGVLHATIDVERGDNRVELVLINQWGGESRTTLCDVRYKIPPQISEITLKQTQFPNAAAECEVRSPLEMGAPTITLSRNGQTLSNDLYRVEEAADGLGIWRVTAPEIPLVEGKNSLVVLAKNRDGQSERSSNETVVKAPPPVPTVRIISPTTDQAIQTTRVSVAFTVRSGSPLKRVDLISRCPAKGKEERHQLPAEDLPTDKNEFGEYGLVKDFEVTLEPGEMNEISLEATNDGGISAPINPVRLNVLQEPVRVVIDKIDVPTGEGKPLKTLFQAGRNVFDRPAEEGQVQVSGHVEWSSPAAAPSLHKRFVRVSVNGFIRMAQLDLSQVKNGRAEFAVPAVLNREQENRIRIHLPQTAVEMVPPYFADCTKPETRQHLHLVVVGVAKDAEDDGRPADEAQLLNEARGAFQVRDEKNNAFTAHTIHPLVGENATITSIRRQLRKVKREMDRRVLKREPNDVIIFVYKGKEVAGVDTDDFVLATHDNWVSPQSNESAISWKWLNRHFNNMPGAHLVFLESRPGPINAAKEKFPGLHRLTDQGTLGMLRVVQGGIQPGSDLLLAVEQFMVDVVNQGATTVQLGTLHDALGKSIALRAMAFESDVPEDLRSLVLLKQKN